MGAGAFQLVAGFALFTVNVTFAEAAWYLAVSAGVNVTEMTCEPVGRIVPEAGVYAKVPGALAVAFSCAVLSPVPYMISDGDTQTNPGSLDKVLSPHPAVIKQTRAKTDRANFDDLK
jgi:hypothetical protein